MGVLVMKGAIWVSSTVWVGERQRNGRMGEVVLVKGAV